MRITIVAMVHVLMADFQNTQGIIFVVDSNDRERITEAREECKSAVDCYDSQADNAVQRMLSEDELRDALLLVFANKQVRLVSNESWRIWSGLSHTSLYSGVPSSNSLMRRAAHSCLLVLSADRFKVVNGGRTMEASLCSALPPPACSCRLPSLHTLSRERMCTR